MLYAPTARRFQRWVQEEVEDRVARERGRAKKLRNACLAELGNDDWEIVVRALAYLMVVGSPADGAAVRPLLKHPNETVRKGAKTCLFALRRRRLGA